MHITRISLSVVCWWAMIYGIGVAHAQDKIDYLVETINDNHDPLHSNNTPSIHALSNNGIVGIKAVLPLLESDDVSLRNAAMHVIQRATAKMFGHSYTQGWLNDEGERLWRELWVRNGTYDPEADEVARIESANKWRAWLNSIVSQVNGETDLPGQADEAANGMTIDGGMQSPSEAPEIVDDKPNIPIDSPEASLDAQ